MPIVLIGQSISVILCTLSVLGVIDIPSLYTLIPAFVFGLLPDPSDPFDGGIF